MKKIGFVLVVAMLFAAPSVFAQTSTSTAASLQALIESLKAQIAELQAKAAAQKQATTEVREAAGDVRETLILIRELSQGMEGDDVKLLQSALAADLEIYPEGRITGFFGPLTAKAVRRFQAKNGVAQVGRVGPQTLQKLNQELKKNPLAEEVAPGNIKRHCAIVPPGHLVAPGWLRKNQAPIVPVCQTLPPGIAKKIDTATSTAPTSTDTVAPTISAVVATSTTANSATILWTTNESANGALWYATSASVQATGTPAAASSALTINHDLTLVGLNPSTTYYFVVASVDMAGNRTVSAEYSFGTPGLLDTTAPVISGVSTSSLSSNSIRVLWNTNELATSKVWYDTATPLVITTSTASDSTSALSINHDRTLANISASSTYYFIVESADGTGNVARSSELSFSTPQD